MFVEDNRMLAIGTKSRGELGTWGEQCAAAYLQGKNYSILARNWRIRSGELDIVAYDPQRDALVAIEVKTRRSKQAGTPEESISATKLRRLRVLLITWAVEQKRVWANLAVDAIGIEVCGQGYFLRHIEDLQL